MGANTSTTVSTYWAPQQSGAKIEVTLDPTDAIKETSEQNNTAMATYTGGEQRFVPYLADVRIPSELLLDADHDGYARSVTIAADVNSEASGSVYFEVWRKDPSGDRKLATSPTFAVSGTEADYQAVILDADTHGLTHGTCNFVMNLYRSDGSLVQTWTRADDHDLGDINMESSAEDAFVLQAIQVPYFSQEDTQWCWATSLSMILTYYGYGQPPWQTRPWQIAAFFEKGPGGGAIPLVDDIEG